jgi:two-component system LytT family response regulator/two-component system response regulator LytT
MILRVLIVDDESLAREEIAYLLGRQDDVEVVGQAADGTQALRLVEELSPDLVLLDIQMPGLGGLEVARRLAARAGPPQIVFVTAYDQYALDAFAVSAIDYLLKPIEPARLEQTMARVRRRVEGDRRPADVADLTNDSVQRLVQLVAERQTRRERLAIKVGERLLLVAAEEMIYASVVDDTILVVTGQVTGTSNYRTLDELQAHLDPAIFWRVHRSHLVNINKIKEIVPWFSRNYILRMRDAKATEIPVSRSQTKRLREYLGL